MWAMCHFKIWFGRSFKALPSLIVGECDVYCVDDATITLCKMEAIGAGTEAVESGDLLCWHFFVSWIFMTISNMFPLEYGIIINDAGFVTCHVASCIRWIYWLWPSKWWTPDTEPVSEDSSDLGPLSKDVESLVSNPSLQDGIGTWVISTKLPKRTPSPSSPEISGQFFGKGLNRRIPKHRGP